MTVQCLSPYVDWKGRVWGCCLPEGHGGDHYSEDNDSWWCWYRGELVEVAD